MVEVWRRCRPVSSLFRLGHHDISDARADDSRWQVMAHYNIQPDFEKFVNKNNPDVSPPLGLPSPSPLRTQRRVQSGASTSRLFCRRSPPRIHVRRK